MFMLHVRKQVSISTSADEVGSFTQLVYQNLLNLVTLRTD